MEEYHNYTRTGNIVSAVSALLLIVSLGVFLYVNSQQSKEIAKISELIDTTTISFNGIWESIGGQYQIVETRDSIILVEVSNGEISAMGAGTRGQNNTANLAVETIGGISTPVSIRALNDTQIVIRVAQNSYTLSKR